MTDKELRRLSRLELLELLLAESRENDKLKEEVEQLKNTNELAKAADNLTKTARQLGEILDNAKGLTDTLGSISSADIVRTDESTPETDIQKKATKPELQQKKNSKDAELYERLMVFFYRNPEALSTLPYDLYFDIMTRMQEIISGKN